MRSGCCSILLHLTRSLVCSGCVHQQHRTPASGLVHLQGTRGTIWLCAPSCLPAALNAPHEPLPRTPPGIRQPPPAQVGYGPLLALAQNPPAADTTDRFLVDLDSLVSAQGGERGGGGEPEGGGAHRPPGQPARHQVSLVCLCEFKIFFLNKILSQGAQPCGQPSGRRGGRRRVWWRDVSNDDTLTYCNQGRGRRPGGGDHRPNHAHPQDPHAGQVSPLGQLPTVFRTLLIKHAGGAAGLRACTHCPVQLPLSSPDAYYRHMRSLHPDERRTK